jgi:hypothetical protein
MPADLRAAIATGTLTRSSQMISGRSMLESDWEE